MARLVERRGRVVVERPPIQPRVDAREEAVEAPDRWWVPRSPVILGVALALPVIAVAMSLAWLFMGGAAPVPAGSIRIAPRPIVSPAPPAPAMSAIPPVTTPATESGPAVAAVAASPERAPAKAAPDPAPAVAATPALTSQPLARDELREVQARLSALGFAAGPADGVAGPQTQAALRRYAESRRLAGRDLDRALLERLRAEPSKAP